MLPAAVAAALILGAARAASQCEGSFLHGVASGDPTPEAVVLWTRVTPASTLKAEGQVVRWVVWPEEAGVAPAVSGETLALPSRDFTVKVDISDNLRPRMRYSYRFECGVARSPMGRFRLPPVADEPVEEVRFAIFSCSNWQSGFFAAYAAAASTAAAQGGLDFWLHLGDFIYEYPNELHGAVRTGLEPEHEVLSLEDYRQRYALYRRDADLQRLSAVAPLVAIWDDHELANDAWMHGAENHQPETEGSFQARKVAALRAYHEWMPTRHGIEPIQTSLAHSAGGAAGAGDPESPWRRWRRFDFGKLASLLLLETRHTARTTQAALTSEHVHAEMAALFKAAGDPTPDRWNGSRLEGELQELRARVEAHRRAETKHILGQEQEAWLREQAAQVAERGAVWRLVAQPLVMQELMSPDYEGAERQASQAGHLEAAQRWAAVLANATEVGRILAASGDGSPLPVTPEQRRQVLVALAAGRYRINLDYDGWMGYVAARERLARALSQGKPVNTIVYGGDSHNAWAGTISDTSGHAVALEFDGMSVTSRGREDYAPWVPPDLEAAAWRAANKGLAWADTSRRGFMLVHLNQSMQEVRYLAVDTRAGAADTTECLAAFVAVPGRGTCPHMAFTAHGAAKAIKPATLTRKARPSLRVHSPQGSGPGLL